MCLLCDLLVLQIGPHQGNRSILLITIVTLYHVTWISIHQCCLKTYKYVFNDIYIYNCLCQCNITHAYIHINVNIYMYIHHKLSSIIYIYIHKNLHVKHTCIQPPKTLTSKLRPFLVKQKLPGILSLKFRLRKFQPWRNWPSDSGRFFPHRDPCDWVDLPIDVVDVYL